MGRTGRAMDAPVTTLWLLWPIMCLSRTHLWPSWPRDVTRTTCWYPPSGPPLGSLCRELAGGPGLLGVRARMTGDAPEGGQVDLGGPVPIPVTVLSPFPALCQGIAQTLDPGRYRYEAVAAANWHTWIGRAGPRAALVCLDSKRSWSRLAEAASLDNVTTVAVVAPFDMASLLRALRLRADGVAYLSDPPDRMVRVLEAAQAGDFLLSRGDAQTIAHETRLASELSEPDIRILEGLAAGASVVEIAANEHFSSRTARRRIHDICHRLDASDVPSALAVARAMGLIE